MNNCSMNYVLFNDDCISALKDLPDNSIDSLITDPPAGISFMGKEWDEDKGGRKQWVAWMSSVMTECYRVLKPGAHGLVWAIPRTSHWTATALEDAGFEVRDRISHLFGQGFPKSLNVNKDLEKRGLVCACEKTETSLSDMQDGVYSEEQDSPIESEVLQQQMSGDLEVTRPSNSKTSESNITLRNSSLYAGNKQTERASDGKESSMEGRSDLQTKQGQLHRTKVREVPEGISTNGAQGRLHNGAQASDGDASRAPFRESRSSTSQRPQHPEQLDRESGTISEQSSAQTCRSCGKKKIQSGIGTALKPSVEDWWLVRKPIEEKTVAANVLKHGTGGINIDASRIEVDQNDINHRKPSVPFTGRFYEVADGKSNGRPTENLNAQGRFPSNLVLSHNPDCDESSIEGKVLWWDERDGQGIVKTSNNEEYYIDESVILTPIKSGDTVYFTHNTDISERLCGKNVRHTKCTEGCAVAMLDAQSGTLKSGTGNKNISNRDNGKTIGHGLGKGNGLGIGGDSGGASRFFYCAKASKKDKGKDNTHPTIKSTTLMSYLIKLITPPEGVVLDPFMGSGSTGVAAVKEGFRFIGIEKEVEYYAISEKRIGHIDPAA